MWLQNIGTIHTHFVRFTIKMNSRDFKTKVYEAWWAHMIVIKMNSKDLDARFMNRI